MVYVDALVSNSNFIVLPSINSEYSSTSIPITNMLVCARPLNAVSSRPPWLTVNPVYVLKSLFVIGRLNE